MTTPFSDSLKEECGVFGIFNCKEAAKICYLGLYSLQHRGQESTGIVSSEGKNFYAVKEMGLVSKVYDPDTLNHLKGSSAIGHVRYSTTGESHFTNIQPLFTKTNIGKIAIAHNGNLTNANKLYSKLKKEGALFQSTVDSEVILHFLAKSKIDNLIDNIQQTLSKIEGSYSIVMLGEDFLVAARDPHGFRPLVLGKLNDGYVVASETCALDLIGAEFEREVNPGEIIFIDKKHGLRSFVIPIKRKPALCVFEYVYFARPDSVIFGNTVHLVRKEFGKMLAREYPIDADIVMSIPDSGNSAALGYAEESGVPFEFGMTRNHYVGRTFIQPSQKIRNFDVRVKLNPIPEVLKGKRVVVIDDSIVRGTTSRQRVAAIRKAGAKEVHMRISSPPVQYPCHFGIDTPKREKLIAAIKNIDEIRKYINADSLGYLSINGMLNAIKNINPAHFCTACFSGHYPIKVSHRGKQAIEPRRINLYAQKNRH